MPLPARDRILDAAISCFASRGYAGTTIADIEAAAGFSPRAGGTYRHFKSKQAILEAAVERLLTMSDDELAPVPASPEEAARTALAQLDVLRDVTLMLFRALDEFPELLERVVDRLVTGPYRVVAERLAALAPGVDADAVVVLLLGGLNNYKLIEALVGHQPTGLNDDRLAAAWGFVYRAVVEMGKVSDASD